MAKGNKRRSKSIEFPHHSDYSVQEEQGNKQESSQRGIQLPDKVTGETVQGRSGHGQLKSSEQATEMIKSNYQRLRKLLYMEQGRSRIFEECYNCMRRRNNEIAKATNTLHAMMFSGKTFGSRYLITALKRKQRIVDC